MREIGRRAVATRGFDRVVSLLERLDRPSANSLAVLMYHRVGAPEDAPHLDPGLISATTAEFEEQMRYLAGTGRVVSAEHVLAARRGDERLPAGAILITFDDAYGDFAENAWPALRRHGLPVILFVPTGFPDAPERTFWWDRLHQALATSQSREPLETPAGVLPVASEEQRRRAFTMLRDHLKRIDDSEAQSIVDTLVTELGNPRPENAVLGWAELRRLAAEGVTLAPHTRTHVFLDRVPLERAEDEIRGSRADLDRELGESPPLFAYPAGAKTEGVVRVLAEAGVEVAFTTERGVNDLRRPDWLQLRRINVGGRSTLPVIRAQLLSFAPGRA